MARTKNLQIPEEALETLKYIKKLQAGNVEKDEEAPRTFGDWQEIIDWLHSSYQRGYKHQGKMGALDFLNAAIYTATQSDGKVKYLLEQVQVYEEQKSTEIDRSVDCAPALSKEVRIDRRVSAERMRWVEDFVKWSDYYSPRGHRLFHLGMSMWLLSALAARRVVINEGRGKYTPVYALLASDTSKWAKSTTVDNVRMLLRYMERDWMLIPGKTTPQLFMRNATRYVADDYDELTPKQQEELHRLLAYAGKLSMIYDEFGGRLNTLMQPSGVMRAFMEIFLEWFDCPEFDSNGTIGRGSDRVEKPYLAILASMTIENMQSLPKTVNLFANGFMARFLLLTPPKDSWNLKHKPKGRMKFPSEVVDPIMNFLNLLPEPSIEGVRAKMDKDGKPTGKFEVVANEYPEIEVTIDDAAEDAYEAYGDEIGGMIGQDRIPKDLHGNYSRLPNFARTFAVLLSLTDNDGHVTYEHWAAGQAIAEEMRIGAHEFYNQYMKVEASPARKIEERLVKFITAHAATGGLTAGDAQGRVGGITAKQCKEALENMADIGTLVRHSVPSKRSPSQFITIYNIPDGAAPEGAVDPTASVEGKAEI